MNRNAMLLSLPVLLLTGCINYTNNINTGGGDAYLSNGNQSVINNAGGAEGAEAGNKEEKKEPEQPVQEPEPSDSQSFTETVNGVSFKMIKVEGGTFLMGSFDDEDPVHSETLTDYYIAETEVTQELWKAVMGSHPKNCRWRGAHLPVESVTWSDVQTFIRKLNELTGKSFRPPTEAEWEFAARGGNKSQCYEYSGSNIIGEVAWYEEDCRDLYDAWRKGFYNRATPIRNVGTKKANELGIYDMSGNVWEWCQNDYDIRYYTSNSVGAYQGSSPVFRGGGILSLAWICRVSYRQQHYPGNGYDSVGFRLAL